MSPIILDGENYTNWSRVVSNALKSKTKFGFVNGDIREPNPTSPDVYAWEKCNSMVTARLYNVIERKLHGSVTYVETAYQIQTDMKDRYSQSNEIKSPSIEKRNHTHRPRNNKCE